MYCWPACTVSSSIRPLVRLFYDCTLSGKALSTGVLPLSVLYRLAKVGLSDEVRAQALVLHLHYSFLREQIPRHVGPFHCASYSFHYRGLSRPVESRFWITGGASKPVDQSVPTFSETKTLVNQSIVPDSSSSCTTSLVSCDGVLIVSHLSVISVLVLHAPY